jgi:hypothetical protein
MAGGDGRTINAAYSICSAVQRPDRPGMDICSSLEVSQEPLCESTQARRQLSIFLFRHCVTFFPKVDLKIPCIWKDGIMGCSCHPRQKVLHDLKSVLINLGRKVQNSRRRPPSRSSLRRKSRGERSRNLHIRYICSLRMNADLATRRAVVWSENSKNDGCLFIIESIFSLKSV